jgi:hypothetical protein
MKNRLVPAAAVVLMCALIGHAQAMLTGKWQGETPNGSSILLDLTVKGTTLTGTMTRNGERIPLSDGQVSKNTFSFKATINDQTEGFSGELTEDQLKVWLDRQGVSKAVVLKRVKAGSQERASWAMGF